MATKITAFLLILLTNAAIGVGLFFFLLLSLNGFSERDAKYAFTVFIAGGILISLLAATAGFFLVKFLTGKQWKPFSSVALSVVALSGVGFALKFVLFIVAIIAADYARTSR